MVVCFAYGCNHNNEGYNCRMFGFPSDVDHKKAYLVWKNMSRRGDRDPKPKTDRLCSCHFKGGIHKIGKEYQNPTIFERNETKVMQFESPEKKKRKKTERKRKLFSTPSSKPSTISTPDHHQTPPSCSSSPMDFTSPEPYYSPDGMSKQDMDLVLLKTENLRLKDDVSRLERELSQRRFSYIQVKGDDKLIKHYTGLSPTAFLALDALCSRFEINYHRGWNVVTISRQDQLFLTLMKLRLNLSYIDLALRFSISDSTVSNIVSIWICVLNEILVNGMMGNQIPSVAKNQLCLPGSFHNFSNCRIVLDCTEVQCAQVRDDMSVQKETYSNYKSRNTFKALVGVAPNGVITYVSNLYPGSRSDKAIVTHTGILGKLVPGDLVLADKGFLIMDDMPQGVSLNLPPFLMKPQFTECEAKFTVKIAKARIHVERAIGRIKDYAILTFIDGHLRPFASSIFKVCAALVNLQNPILQETAGSLG